LPRQPSVDQRRLVELLCLDMSETERAKQLGVARSSYYDALDRLVQDGLLKNRGVLAEGMTCMGAHPRSKYTPTRHAPVMHVSWPAGLGRWSVQGALLDKWDKESKSDTVVTVRWSVKPGKSLDMLAFVVTPPARWSTRDTERCLSKTWLLTASATEALTIAIARVLDAEAMLIPEGW
jgi:hypothetical protein